MWDEIDRHFNNTNHSAKNSSKNGNGNEWPRLQSAFGSCKNADKGEHKNFQD